MHLETRRTFLSKIRVLIFIWFFSFEITDNCESCGFHQLLCVFRGTEGLVGLVSVPNELLVMQKACHCNKSVLTALRVPSKCSGVVLSKCTRLL